MKASPWVVATTAAVLLGATFVLLPTKPTSSQSADFSTEVSVAADEAEQEAVLSSASDGRGIRHFGVSESTNAWLASLPVSSREKASQFVVRNGVAYQSNSADVTAWMLAHGFPSLESVAEFDPTRAESRCSPIHCSDRIESSLLAESYLSMLESDAISPQDEFNIAAKAGSYIDRARSLGSVVYAAHLEARLQRAQGNAEASDVALALAAACGDRRVESRFSGQAMQIIRMVPGAQQSCGFRPGLPQFPR